MAYWAYSKWLKCLSGFPHNFIFLGPESICVQNFNWPTQLTSFCLWFKNKLLCSPQWTQEFWTAGVWEAPVPCSAWEETKVHTLGTLRLNFSRCVVYKPEVWLYGTTADAFWAGNIKHTTTFIQWWWSLVKTFHLNVIKMQFTVG